MLSFDLRSLEANAARVDGDLTRDDAVWEPDDERPIEAAHVSGRISMAGSRKFYFSGRLEGRARSACRRCLVDTTVTIDEALQMLFADVDATEAEEPDVYVIPARGHELDLRPALREAWLLAFPAFPVCAETCRGLCPQCGVNRNETSCDCRAATDPRWSELAALRDEVQ
jgi:uncharacterized protein